jgi:hypothetical protein
MNWIVAKMKWIMLVSGALTCTMVYVAVAPEAALRTTYGETLQGPLAQIVVRSWGAVIAVIGVMLIYGAFNPPSRPLVLIVAGLSKLIFIGLVLIYGSQYLGQRVGISIVVDLVMVLLFVAYLAAVGREKAAA